MLVPELGVALLNIPKCGSSTVRQCLQLHSERKQVSCIQGDYNNHLTLSEIKETAQKDGIDLNQLRIVGIVRNPIDRYLSNLNYTFSGKYGCGLEDFIDMTLCDDFLAQESKFMNANFRRMMTFLDCKLENLQLYPFEYLEHSVRSFGYIGQIPRLNKSRVRFTFDHLKPFTDRVKSFYKDDFEIYNRIAASVKEYKTCMLS